MKKLQELSQEEYQTLNNMGFLWELYPEATGNWKYDTIGKSTQYVQIRLVSVNNDNGEVITEHSVAMDYDKNPFVEDLVELFFKFYKQEGFQNSLEVKIKNISRPSDILYCDIE